MYHHRITYKPESERKQRESEDRFLFIACVIVFAFIGCMLAWRG